MSERERIARAVSAAGVFDEGRARSVLAVLAAANADARTRLVVAQPLEPAARRDAA